MKNIHAIAHTHWDFEWYFTRQEAQVQFAFHMDEVFSALASHQLDYYLLDGQLSIVDDYLSNFPEKASEFQKYVQAKRLFIGPWYTQVDEMVTSGEAMVRNLRLGTQLGADLGGAMAVGYLPDSFGQSQDMPKIYNGFDIYDAVFWRGTPLEKNARYFYWTSDDDHKVLVANIKNGYYAGVDLVENADFKTLMARIGTDTTANDLALPIGGDQRAVDFNLKTRIQLANNASDGDYQVKESTYPQFFQALAQQPDLPTYQGEFIDPSVSKIHRGIYSSRYDLKQAYDELERLMIHQVEPLLAMAMDQGVASKQGLIDTIWQTIARGQAHDSSGGCNSDETNRDIANRAQVALELGRSLRDYLLRKLSISLGTEGTGDVLFWNPWPTAQHFTRRLEVSTPTPNFRLVRTTGADLPFTVLAQEKRDASVLKRDPSQQDHQYYYVTTISCRPQVPAMDWQGYRLETTTTAGATTALKDATVIENEFYQLTFEKGQVNLFQKATGTWHHNFLTFEDGSDAGDTYDYAPDFKDWVLALDLSGAKQVAFKAGDLTSTATLAGTWNLPQDLAARQDEIAATKVPYKLVLRLNQGSKVIDFRFTIDNTVLDHRLRLVLNTDVQVDETFADTPFGTIARPVTEAHLQDWQQIGYHEEPTSMRPMIHFANVHTQANSWSFITLGTKDFQVIGDHRQLAITLFRSVGYLGRPNLTRRPGDASGLVNKLVATPDSQLLQTLTFAGGLVVDPHYDPVALQAAHHELASAPLYYQQQTLNKFTTPIEYFTMNKLAQAVDHPAPIVLADSHVVLSSFTRSVDQTGFELRLYNPTAAPAEAGVLQLPDTATLALVNLKGEVQQLVAHNSAAVALTPFEPGEIRTYGIYPVNTGSQN
ncbi:MAG: alpha-mannosidase [Lactobacillus sp.]|nr:alpha-mannosidase [Lactobacillus sp.]